MPRRGNEVNVGGNPYGIGGQPRYDQTGRLLSGPGGSDPNPQLPPEAYGNRPTSFPTSTGPAGWAETSPFGGWSGGLPGPDIPAADSPYYDYRRETGGGLPPPPGDYPAGGYPYPYPDQNIPTNENVSPTPSLNLQPSSPSDYQNQPIPAVQQLLFGNNQYPNLSNAPPVTPEGYVFPQNISPQYAPASSAYPMVGGWNPRGSSFDPATGRNWRDNAERPPVIAQPPQTPSGQTFGPLPGENWIGGGPAFTDPYTNQLVWNPLGTMSGREGVAGNSGYGSGRFAGPSVSFGYGGTMIGPTSGSIFGGNPMHGTVLPT